MLERKEHAVQTLRLRAGFAHAHELTIEEKLWRRRSVDLQRALTAAAGGAATEVHVGGGVRRVLSPVAQLREEHSALVAAHARSEALTNAAEGTAHGRWRALDAQVAPLVALVDGLSANIDSCLGERSRQRDAEQEADATILQEAVALEQRVEAAKSELSRLRLGAERAERSGGSAEPLPELDDAEAAVGQLHEEVSKLRSKKAELLEELAATARSEVPAAGGGAA